MSCSSCKNTSSSCKSCSSPCTKACGVCVCPQCTAVCTALVVSNSWNVPACGAEAVLSIPGLTTVLIGAYIYNPTYGRFRITAFDSVNQQVTVINECLSGNAAPGTVVPALTSFIFSAPPSSGDATNISSWSIPTCDNTATIETAGLTNVVIGSYLWNPTYGYFQVAAFDSSNGEITVLNECFAENAAALTVVPAGTTFLFVDTPGFSSVIPYDSWIVPACAGSVILGNVPGLRGVVIDSYIWNPTYGYFRVTAYNSSTGELTLTNDCFSVNAAPTTVVPAETPFVFVDGAAAPITDNGWTDAQETWTFASATQVNVPATATVKYQPGDKVWIQQLGSDAWFSVFAVGVNTLDLYAGDDYVVVNAPIDNPRYSHQESPVGFPPYFNWTPVLSASGAMTVVLNNVDKAQAYIANGHLEFDLAVRFTLAGVAGVSVFSTTPITDIESDNSFTTYLAAADDTGADFTGGFRVNGTPAIEVFKPAAANWALGAAQFTVRGRAALA